MEVLAAELDGDVLHGTQSADGSLQRLPPRAWRSRATASAVNTVVRWASIESSWW